MKSRGYLLSCCALSVLGCTGGGPEAGGEERLPGVERTGIAVQAAVEADVQVDVGQINYTIERVACADGEQFEPIRREVQVELRPLELPGGITGLENSPLDGPSRHKFADHFEVLPAGCYDVVATPLAADGAASPECGAARTNGIQVRDGETTEVFMLSQCMGPETGALDAVVAFNQPPQLIDLTFTPSKFVAAGQTATVCATAVDPNGDQLEFEWAQIGGGEAGNGATVAEAPAPPDSSATCVDITPGQAGAYDFEVRIFDLLRDANGNLIRFERYHADHGSPNLSSDSLRFPIYAAAAAPEEGGPGAGAPEEGGPGAGAPEEGGPGAGAPEEGGPGAGAPEEGGPGAGAPEEGGPGAGAPEEGGPGAGAPEEGGPGAGAPGEGAPGEGAPEEGGGGEGGAANGG